MKEYLRKILLGGLCALTLGGYFYLTKTLEDRFLPEPPKIEQKNEKKELEKKIKGIWNSFEKLVQNIGNAVVCDHEIKPRHTKEQIEEIVNSVNTPKEAFEKIKKDIKFSSKSDWLSGCFLGRYMSLRETYASGNGDCSEGAIAFVAMLSNNPEYDAQVVYLPPKEEVLWGHVVALFTEKGKWGAVSFNDPHGLENRSIFYPANYASIDETITSIWREEHEKYALMHYTSEELKFGRALQNKRLPVQWHPINNKNE